MKPNVEIWNKLLPKVCGGGAIDLLPPFSYAPEYSYKIDITECTYQLGN